MLECRRHQCDERFEQGYRRSPYLLWQTLHSRHADLGRLLLDFLASGATFEEILEEYPQLRREDILAAIAYGAEMSRERYVDLPGRSAA